MYSSRAYVELDDGTGRLSAVMFGEVVEKAFGYSAVELMKRPITHQDESVDVCNEDHRRALRDPEDILHVAKRLVKDFTNRQSVYAGQAHSGSKFDQFCRLHPPMFFPEVFREAKARGFADLRKRDISLHQYALKFIKLSRFAPYLIADKSRKAKKFGRALHPQILDRLIALKLRNFNALVDRAMIVEEYLQSREARILL